jgi:hypothetical protein
MVDIAAITVAIISLIASLAVAVASGFLAIYSDDRKHRQERERLMRKYRDPLLLAAQDLQNRLYNIVHRKILDKWIDGSQEQKDCLVIYTAFLVGQYLAWTHILRLEAQFACFATEESDRTMLLVSVLARIQKCLDEDNSNSDEPKTPFRMWKGHQFAIGELMTVPSTVGVSESPGGVSMGFAEFTRKWKAQAEDVRIQQPASDDAKEGVVLQIEAPRAFRVWFTDVEHGIYELGRQKKLGEPIRFDRIGRLQHLLVELLRVLDPKGVRVWEKETYRLENEYAPVPCACFKCAPVKKKTKCEKILHFWGCLFGRRNKTNSCADGGKKTEGAV